MIEEKIISWIRDFVEVPNLHLNNWAPCPFARKARIDNKIHILPGKDSVLLDIKESLVFLENYDVVVIWYDTTKFTASEFEESVKLANAELKSDNIVILEDHPDNSEYVNDVKMNFGHCALLVVQYLDKLNTASDQLKLKGYYDVWSQESIDNVVTWRNSK